MKRTQAKKPSALKFYWYEIRPNEAKGAVWGQFMGAIHRLLDIDEELTDALRQRDIRKQLHRVTRITESYLHRVYELRERMVNLLAMVTGNTTAAKATKNPQKRANALSRIQGSHRALCEGVDRLMGMLDDDVLLRNMHTHQQFLSLGLMAYNGPYDPDDVLMELEHQPDERKAMNSLLRKETRKLADEYRTRIQSVRDAAVALAKISNPIRPPKE
ncbi:MAG: hypothetical protein HJJLKODD_02681 [Phycisphaerae bacterium]|nr:hypothetical protein [Phycisphaerae bacterium]